MFLVSVAARSGRFNRTVPVSWLSLSDLIARSLRAVMPLGPGPGGRSLGVAGLEKDLGRVNTDGGKELSLPYRM